MGNLLCPVESVAHLANVAQEFCPFPDYSPNPHFAMLSLSSSLHLKNHYTAVQSSLTPQQLEDFTQNLRTTFGRRGYVTHGGVGVVALSLAFFFDAVARQVRGERESQWEPIPGLFIKDHRGFYQPMVYTISQYLRLVPYIANNPIRMMEETERFLEKLKNEDQTVAEDFNKLTKVEDITAINLSMIQFFEKSLNIHLKRLKNDTELFSFEKYTNTPDLVFNLNCDVEAVSKEFVAAIPSFDNRTREAFQQCNPNDEDHPVLQNIARFHWLNMLFSPFHSFKGNADTLVAQSDDFDLKANALGTWK